MFVRVCVRRAIHHTLLVEEKLHCRHHRHPSHTIHGSRATCMNAYIVHACMHDCDFTLVCMSHTGQQSLQAVRKVTLVHGLPRASKWAVAPMKSRKARDPTIRIDREAQILKFNVIAWSNLKDRSGEMTRRVILK